MKIPIEAHHEPDDLFPVCVLKWNLSVMRFEVVHVIKLDLACISSCYEGSTLLPTCVCHLYEREVEDDCGWWQRRTMLN